MQCTDVPVCKTYSTDTAAALKVLGWSDQVTTFSAAKGDTALEQAVALKPDYIMMSGGDPAALLPTGLAAAHKAGIPVTTFGATDASNPTSGFTAVAYNNSSPYTNNIVAWGARDGGGEAHILFVNLPAFPVFAAAGAAASQYIAKTCPGCIFKQLNVSNEQLAAGNLPSLVVSALQADPSLNYVTLEFSDLIAGIVPAVKAAGFSNRVKLTGGEINAQSLQAMLQGDARAWSVVPIASQAWLAVDALARTSVGMTLTPSYFKQIENYPSWVVDTTSEAKALAKNPSTDPWPGPAGWQQQYEALWHVTG